MNNKIVTDDRRLMDGMLKSYFLSSGLKPSEVDELPKWMVKLMIDINNYKADKKIFEKMEKNNRIGIGG